MNQFYTDAINPPYKKDSKQYSAIVDSIVKLRTKFNSTELYKIANRKLNKGEKLEWHKMQDTIRVLVKNNLVEYHIDNDKKFYLQLTQKTTVK